VSFAATTLRVASQRMFIVVVYFIIGSVRKILDTPSYISVKKNGICFVTEQQERWVLIIQNLPVTLIEFEYRKCFYLTTVDI
jgi:hypothetical protein